MAALSESSASPIETDSAAIDSVIGIAPAPPGPGRRNRDFNPSARLATAMSFAATPFLCTDHAGPKRKSPAPSSTRRGSGSTAYPRDANREVAALALFNSKTGRIRHNRRVHTMWATFRLNAILRRVASFCLGTLVHQNAEARKP